MSSNTTEAAFADLDYAGCERAVFAAILRGLARQYRLAVILRRALPEDEEIQAAVHQIRGGIQAARRGEYPPFTRTPNAIFVTRYQRIPYRPEPETPDRRFRQYVKDQPYGDMRRVASQEKP